MKIHCLKKVGGKNKTVIRVLVKAFIHLLLFVFTTRAKPDLYIFAGIYLEDIGKEDKQFWKRECAIHSELGVKCPPTSGLYENRLLALWKKSTHLFNRTRNTILKQIFEKIWQTLLTWKNRIDIDLIVSAFIQQNRGKENCFQFK